MKRIIINNINGSYICQKKHYDINLKLEVLADWLLYDVWTDSAHWTEWINYQKKDTASSNTTWLIKYEGQIVLCGSTDMQRIKDYEIPGKYTVVISPDNLIELLDTWQIMLQLRPNQIVITEENDIYKMFAVQ